MIAVHRRMPTRKTLGTRFNLKPDTELVEARRLQIGDVVLLEPEHPTVVTKMRRFGRIHLWGRYVWQAEFDAHWPLGDFQPTERIPRAIPGEYPKPARPIR